MSAELSITVFVLAITGATLYLSFLDLSTNKYVSLVLKRSLFIITMYLMAQNSAIMLTISESASLNLSGELSGYIFIFGIVGYILILFTIIRTIFDLFNLVAYDKLEARTGEDV
jgi:hypothetical protein